MSLTYKVCGCTAMNRKQNGSCVDVKFDEGPRSTIATLSIDTFDGAGNSGSRPWFWMTV